MSTDELLARLCDLRAVIQGGVALPAKTTVQDWRVDDPANVLWLQMRHEPSQNRDLLVALELLAILSIVDVGLWQRHVEAIWPHRVSEWSDVFQLHSFRVGIDVRTFSDKETAIAMAFLSERSTPRVEISLPNNATSHVPVRVWIAAAQGRRLSSRLATVEQLVATQRSRVRHSGGESQYQGIRVEHLAFDQHTVANDAVLKCVLKIEGMGVKVHSIPEFEWRRDKDSVYHRLPLMRAFFQLNGRGNNRGFSTFSHEHDQPLEVIYSALSLSQSVRSVYVQPPPPLQDIDRGRFWKWVAYGLFCRHGKPQQIQGAQICVDSLRLEDLASIHQLLTERNPLEGLFGFNNSYDPLGTVCTTRIGFPSAPDRFVACLLELPVIRQAGSFFLVLYPGYGEAWTHTDFITSCNREAVASLQSIPHLTLSGLSPASLEATLGLLSLVGGDVLHISLKRIQQATTLDEWLRGLFRACPNLQVLELHHGTLGSLQVLLDEYQSGCCRLRRLSLSCIRVIDFPASLMQFFAALSNPLHPAALHLREFVIDPLGPRVILSGPVLSMARAMLQANSRLSNFEIRVHPVVFHQHKRALAEFDNTAMLERLGPLATDAKLAFLSVVRAVCEMSDDLVSLIFLFAAQRQTRRAVVAKFEPEFRL